MKTHSFRPEALKVGSCGDTSTNTNVSTVKCAYTFKHPKMVKMVKMPHHLGFNFNHGSIELEFFHLAFALP